MMPDITASDFAEQLAARLKEVDQKGAKIKSQMVPLIQEREQALVAGNTTTSVALKHQLNQLQENLEDLEYAKKAVQAKLRVYDQKAPEAAKVRDKVNAFWEEGRALIDEFVKMQSRARILYGKALDLENKISALGNEHLRLVGRDMRGPPSITGAVWQLGAFTGPNVQAVKPLEPWVYRSDEEIAAKRNEELQTKLQAHEKRLEIAEEHAPNCPNCARADVETKMIVDRRSGHSDSQGQAGSGHMSHHWHFVCPKCGATMTQPIPETKPE
jgi:rubrerythrin